MAQPRRTTLRTLGGTLIAFGIGACRVFGAPADDSAFQEALAEMRAVETSISARLREQSAREGEERDLNRSLKVTEEFLLGNDKVRKENRRILEGMRGTIQRNSAAMDQVIAETRRDLAGAQAGIALAAPLALLEARGRGQTDRRAFTLAMLHMAHRERAHSAVAQALRLEDLKSDRKTSEEKINSQVELYAALDRLPVNKLRERHRQLSRQLDRLHSAASQGPSGLASLQTKRDALNRLIAGLASGRLGAAAVRELEKPRSLASASPREKPPRAPEPPVSGAQGDAAGPENPDLPEVPYDDTQTVLPLGTREGDGAPTMKLEIREDDSPRVTEGPRQTFWQATASEVHALLAGKALFSGSFAGYRHLLILDHGDGYATLYGNLSHCELQEGAMVGQGETVGSYEAGTEDQPQEFWIEARRNSQPIPIEKLPGVPSSWKGLLFEGGAP